MAWSSFRESFFLFYRRLGIFLLANVLWIVLSLPLITMPAATGALYYLVDRVIAEELDLKPVTATIGDFWTGLRFHWQRSTLVMLINLSIFAFLIVTSIFYWQNPNELLGWLIGPTLLILLGFLAMNVYLMPLRQIYHDDSVGTIFRRAIRLVLTYPLESFWLLVWLLLLSVLCTIFGGPVIFLLFSLIALIQSYMLRTIRIQQGEIAEPDFEKSGFTGRRHK